MSLQGPNSPSSATEPTVILVDDEDRPVGTAGKAHAHIAPGHLHRALSAFVFNGEDEIILQRRAATKYHFAGLWSNTCCTHPEPGETTVAAGERRLGEELGFTCELTDVGAFRYRAVDDSSGLVEHELDHVLVGRSHAVPVPNPAEVDEVRTVSLEALQHEIARDPRRFTPWLPPALAVLELATDPPPHQEP